MNIPSLRAALVALALGASAVAAAQPAAAQSDPAPNIVFIVADDLGVHTRSYR